MWSSTTRRGQPESYYNAAWVKSAYVLKVNRRVYVTGSRCHVEQETRHFNLSAVLENRKEMWIQFVLHVPCPLIYFMMLMVQLLQSGDSARRSPSWLWFSASSDCEAWSLFLFHEAVVLTRSANAYLCCVCILFVHVENCGVQIGGGVTSEQRAKMSCESTARTDFGEAEMSVCQNAIQQVS